jgi:hypothetical protein
MREYGCGAAVLSGLVGILAHAAEGPSAAADWLLPLETAAVHGPWQGKGNLRQVVDRDSGRAVLEYEAAFEGTDTELWMDLDRVASNRFDLLRFDWRATGDAVLARVTLEGYPEPGGQRNYYLNKNPGTPGEWQRVWLDLGLDDDHPFFPKVEGLPDGRMRLRFRLTLNPVAPHSANPRTILRLADVMLLRPPVTVAGDLRAIRPVDASGVVGQEYALVVRNRAEVPQEVALYLDGSGLREFRAELTEPQFRLGAGKTREIGARMVMDRDRAARLPPLYYETADVFVGVEGQPDSIVPWNWGYMRHRLHAAVPLPPREAPVLLSDEEGAAGRARPAGKAASVATPQQLKEADGLLDYPSTPTNIVHGQPNCYFCPAHNAQLRCEGPGKHRCEKGKELVDMAKMPEHVYRAAGYYEHVKLAETALKLARAGWDSGDRKYLKRAAEILMAYARWYPGVPISDESATSYYGRVGAGNLQESWWYAPLPRVYDLVRAGGVWSEKDAAFVERNLILEGVALLCAHRSVANQQAEYNRGVGVGALAIGNAALAAEALSGEYGMRAQWGFDFDGDGWTMERDWGYQRAAVEPFLDFAKALSAAGVPVFDADFKKLFDAPVLRSPNLSVGLELYVDAMEQYHDPLYRRSVAAYRKEPLPEMPDGFPNSVQPAGGFTMLRTGRNDNDLVSASINWGEPVYRGGKTLLSPTVRWKGCELNAQVMRIAYGSKFSGFSYAATAGNTIVIDGELQSMARAEQRALLDGPCPAGRWTAPATHPQYPGVEWSRSMAICGDSVVVLDQITSAKPVRIDRFTFLPVNEAEAKTADAAEPAFVDDKEFCGDNKQYQYLTGVQRVTGKAPERVSFPLTPDKKRVAVVQLRSPENTQCFRLHAPIAWNVRDAQVWALRRSGETKTWFAEALSGVDTAAGGKPEAVQFERLDVQRDGKPAPPEQALAVRVCNAAGEFLVLTSAFEGPHRVAGRELSGPLAAVPVEP